MNQPIKNKLAVKPNPVKRAIKAKISKISFIEIPVFLTIGAAILCNIAFLMYTGRDEFAKGNNPLRYIPFRSEYEDVRDGFRNIRKRFFKTKPNEDVK